MRSLSFIVPTCVLMGDVRYFVDQPIAHPGVTDKHILLWYFEDWLKKYFYSVLQILEVDRQAALYSVGQD